jgi:hypothetical protein
MKNKEKITQEIQSLMKKETTNVNLSSERALLKDLLKEAKTNSSKSQIAEKVEPVLSKIESSDFDREYNKFDREYNKFDREYNKFDREDS